MKKLFFITCLSILFVIKIFGQAQIDIPLIVTDGTYNIELAVGLDLTATNCIDPQLGEADLPPIPPCGCLVACFDLAPYGCPYISSMKDYRAPGNPPAFPFTGLIQHTLWFQVSSSGLPLNITYNLPYGTLMSITDQIGGIFLNIGPFTGQGVATIPGSYTAIFTKAYLKMQYNSIGGDPGGPIFGLSTYSLNFPQIPTGSDTSLPVTVSNFGITNTLTISDIVSSNSQFTISPNVFPINIAPLSSQVFEVTNTSSATPELGTIQFFHNTFGSPTELNVSAPAGVGPGPIFEISATSLVFLQKPVGTIDSATITISNQGFVNTLYINDITSSNSYFNILPNSVPIVIGPQDSQNFTVTYSSADTLQQGIIEFTHNAPGSPSILNLSSVYELGQFQIHPASLYFYAPSMTKRIWITNTDGNNEIIINSITSTNSNYTVTPINFPISIPPGTTKIIYVNLNSAAGFQFGFIRIFHSASGLPHSVPVSNQIIEPLEEGLFVVSSGTQNRYLEFGFDTLATDMIDEHLGEHGPLPPFPPPGAFEAQFFLPENNFSGTLSAYSDFRFTDNMSSTHKELRLAYQPVPSGEIIVHWYLPSSITGVLQDIINGSFINVPISDTGSFAVPDPYIFNKLKVLIDFDLETPVELISFNATLIDNSVRLDWTTATEMNNSGFEVLRGIYPATSGTQNYSEWRTIGFVPGFGTTTEPKSYSFSDEDVTTGTYKYRLKQIDFDGTFTYSNEIEVEVDFTPNEFVLYQNYPNPFNPSTIIKFEIPSVIASGAKQSQFVTLKVYDILGNEVATLVNEEKQAGVYEVQFNIHSDEGQNLSSGVYFYQLQAGSFSSIKKMVLIK